MSFLVSRPALLALTFVVAGTSVTPTARAAEPSSTEIAVARGLFEEATAFEREERWASAVEKLREALQIKETPGLRFHLAHCEEKLGQLVEALVDYDRARDLIAGGMKAPDVATRLGPAREALASRVPTLVISALANVPGLEVTIEGRVLPLSVLGRPAPVNPGNYRVVARAPGYRDFMREVALGEGEARTIEIRMTRLPPSPAPLAAAPSGELTPTSETEPERRESEQGSAKPYVVAGEALFAAASLAVGIRYLFVKNAARDRIDRAQERVDLYSEGNPSACRDPMAGSDLERHCRELDAAIADPEEDRAELISTLGFVGAGVGAGAAILTYLVWPDDSRTAVVEASFSGDLAWFGLRHRF